MGYLDFLLRCLVNERSYNLPNEGEPTRAIADYDDAAPLWVVLLEESATSGLRSRKVNASFWLSVDRKAITTFPTGLNRCM